MAGVTVRTAGRAQTRRLALMAVVAVLLGTVVAANIVGDPGATEDPRASFTFETDGSDVLVTHFGGDELDPAAVYVESGTRGRLGNFGGSGGMACARNHSQVEQGTTCRVANASFEQLYVVWQGEENRTLILARRGPDPTPTPTPTATATAAPTPTATGTATPGTPGTPTDTETSPTVTETPETATQTADETTASNETGTPDGTATPGTATPADGTATPAGTPTETPSG